MSAISVTSPVTSGSATDNRSVVCAGDGNGHVPGDGCSGRIGYCYGIGLHQLLSLGQIVDGTVGNGKGPVDCSGPVSCSLVGNSRGKGAKDSRRQPVQRNRLTVGQINIGYGKAVRDRQVCAVFTDAKIGYFGDFPGKGALQADNRSRRCCR